LTVQQGMVDSVEQVGQRVGVELYEPVFDVVSAYTLMECRRVSKFSARRAGWWS
jgi:hypothetical protein